MAGRVRYVAGDATAFTDPEPFDMAFWSQFFFPAASRVKTLATAFRLLRPGGLLVVPALPEPVARRIDPRAALRTLLLEAWDVPAVTAGELRIELAAAGFEPTVFGTSVIARRP